MKEDNIMSKDLSGRALSRDSASSFASSFARIPIC
jgi:hypothetical protein